MCNVSRVHIKLVLKTMWSEKLSDEYPAAVCVYQTLE